VANSTSGAGGDGVVIIRYILPDALEPSVTIGGVNYNTEALETVRIVRGRDNVFSEPRAGYAILELVDLAGNGLNFDVLDLLQITLTDTGGDEQVVFTGMVSDWATNLIDTGFESGTAASVTTVIAVAPLAKLNRRNVAAAGRPAQKDGTRILELVTAGLAATWEETPGTWTTVAEDTTTWATFDPDFDAARIDTPGVFDIAALPAEPSGYNPLSQAYLTATSGRGVLFDTADGFVAYADADRREIAATAGYLVLPKDALTARLSTSSTASDIVNRVSVTFDGGAALVSSTPSILLYGVLAREFQTNLVDATAALAWGVDYIEDHEGPVINLSEIGIRLDGLTDTALIDNLLDIDVGTPVFLDDLPETLGVTALPAFVEGITWLINRETVELRLNVSDAALSIGSIRWGAGARHPPMAGCTG
jgi:hypothetical protein